MISVGGGVIGGALTSPPPDVVVTTGSLHPNHPGVKQVVVAVAVADLLVRERVVVVLSSLQPNQPGVLHVVVVLDDVLVVVVVPVVVVSSKQPLRRIVSIENKLWEKGEHTTSRVFDK